MRKITFKRLMETTLREAVEIWNMSFEGYVTDVSMTADQFTARLGLENLSPALSLVGYRGEEPVGIILSGVKRIKGRKVAWNGGTGVVAKFRGQGIGKALLDAALEVYRQEQVESVSLEAFKQNQRAISLYKQAGFQVMDQLLFLEHKGSFRKNPFQSKGDYTPYYGSAQDVSRLPFYQHFGPWQTQCTNIRDGQSVIILDSEGKATGYSLFKRVYEDDKIKSIILYQCQIREDEEEPENAIRYMLNAVFQPGQQDCEGRTFNLSASNERVVQILESGGFTRSAEQVYMVKDL